MTTFTPLCTLLSLLLDTPSLAGPNQPESPLYSPAGGRILCYSDPQTRHSAASGVAKLIKVVILVVLLSRHQEQQEYGFLRTNPSTVAIWLRTTLSYPILHRS